MKSIILTACYNIEKHYSINIIPFRGTEYKDDTDWIAYWFFTQYTNDPEIDNVTIHIKGDFHITYPNPPHLSIYITYENGTKTKMLHLSQDADGNGYLQPLTLAGKGKKTKKRKQKRKYKKQKTKYKK